MKVEIRTDLPARIKRKGKYAVVSESRDAGLGPGGVASETVRVETKDETSASESAPIVELEVLRIPPNPRLVICRDWVCGGERRCMVNVGRNSKFVARMKFSLPEPSDPVARARPWAYAGSLPRRRGRW